MPLIVGDVLPFATTLTDGAGGLHDADTMTLTVTRPDGTALAGSPYTVASTTLGTYDRNVPADMAGRWVGLWTATGTYAGAYAQVFDVEQTALPTWAPTLTDVAVHIPTRTRELRAPLTDLDEYAGTFTDATTPTDREAEGLILRACDWVAARVGTPIEQGTWPMCKLAASLLAAAWIERAYPERDADLTVYQQLRDDADKAITQARDTNVDAGGSGDAPDADLPVNVQFSFPDAPGWADRAFL
jgi:hypothetical protein